MSKLSRRAALATAGTLALAVPGAAQASSKIVYMGVPPASQMAFQPYGADDNAYFPNTITVHKGDSVKFMVTGFHTLDLPAKGKQPVPLIAPAGTISGAKDPSGAAYWFNGQPNLQFNPVLASLNYGKTFSYNGKQHILSGLPLGQHLAPVTVKFTKVGTYTFHCNVHFGMIGKVHVVAPKAKAPTAKSDAKAIRKQVSAALKIAKSLQNPTVPAGRVLLGNAGANGVEVFAMFPAAKTVPVGSTLTFSMTPKSFEVHTATTGPGDPEKDPSSFLGKLSGSLQSPAIDQAAVWPSDPPNSVASLTPSSHGNGFWGTGFLDANTATPLPMTGTVKFAAPGTYNFYCMIHPFMHAVITAK